MGSFELMRDYINSSTGPPEENIHIESIFAISPKTPVTEMKVVKMEVFDENVLRDCIISNIRVQLKHFQKGLKRATWTKLLEFLGSGFDTVTCKTYAQVLVHFTKIRIDEDTLKKQGIIDMDSVMYYDLMLSVFIDGALVPMTDGAVVKKVPLEDDTELKRRLLSKPIRLAIMKSISVLETFPDMPAINDDYICNIINAAQIYETANFNPLSNLRGAALYDGILICTKNVSGSPDSIKYSADILTLASHQLTHYIVRKIFGDFNFSSPWIDHDRNRPRFDFGTVNKQSLEMGRNTEIMLFDGVQPNWFTSFQLAATVFIERIDTNVPSIPVIANHEFGKLGLFERKPSPFFGVDIKAEVLWFE